MNDDLLNKLERLAKLKEQGAITEAEFNRQKAELMNSTPKTPATPEKKKSSGCLTAIMALVIFGGIAGLIGSLSDKSDSSGSTDSTASASAPPTRQEQVEKFFSAWDGSNHELEKAIKASMNDPDSYDHVKTRFRDDKSTIYVLTQFRGKNAFGGTIVNYAQGTLDGNTGKLIEWKFVKE